VQPAKFRVITDMLGTLALILILFEGGLDLDLRETLQHFPGGVLLAIVSYALSVGLVAWVARNTRNSPDFTLRSALLVGAILGCTSSSVVLPVLQQMGIRDPLRVVLLIDSSLSDVLAVTTVNVLLDIGAGGEPFVGGFLGKVSLKMIASIVAAILAGVVWSRALPLLSEQRFWQIVTFSVVLLLYAAAQAASHSGLLAVLTFGLTLANVRRIDPRLLGVLFTVKPLGKEHHVELLAFYSEMAFLVRTFFFVLLGVIVDIRGLRGHVLLTLGSLGALVVARALAVKASRWSWGKMEPREREIALWIFPRGLITAVLAIQVLEARGSQFDFLPAVAFATIVVTNILVVFGSIRAKRGEPPDMEITPVTEETSGVRS
jgi:cell volume regulation protein A